MPTIKELRVAKGWSQQELATYAGVGIHTVGRAESGGNVNQATKRAIAGALGVKPEEITVNVGSRVRNGS